MKKLIIWGILVMMLFSFTACGEQLPTAEELMDRVYEAMKDIDTYKGQMDITVQVYLEAEEFNDEMPFALDVTAEANISYDKDEEEMEVNIDVDIASGDEDMTMKMGIAMYLVDEMIYIMLDAPMAPAEWIKSSIPGDYLGDMDFFEMQLDLLEVADVEILRKERKENIECYLIQITPDIGQIFESMMDIAQVPVEEIPGQELEQITDIFQDFSVMVWIEKETYFVRYVTLEMSAEATPEMMDVYDEEGFMSINATMTMKAYDYNQPVEITLPAEAEEAEESSIW